MLRRLVILTANETGRLVRSRLPYIGFGAIILLSILWPQGASMAGSSNEFTGFVFLKQVAASAMTGVIPLFVVLQASGIVAVDTQQGTMRRILYGPVRRWEVLTAKLAASALHAVVLVALHVASAVAVGARWFTFAGYEEFGEVIVTPAETARHYLVAYAISLAPILATVSLGLFVSVAARTVGTAMGVGTGVLIVMVLFRGFLRFGGVDLEPYLFLSHVGAPLQVAEELSTAMATRWLAPSVVALLTTSGWAILLLLGGAYAVFLRRDVPSS